MDTLSGARRQQSLLIGPVSAYGWGMRKHLFTSALMAALAVLWIRPAVAELVAHKAIYSLKLGTVRAGSNFVGAEGSMSMEMQKTCFGWTLSQSLRMDLALPDGGIITQDLRFTAWESTDKTGYRFFASNIVNGTREDFRGRALMEKSGGVGNANFQQPKGVKIPLPEGTIFPLGHTNWLIQKALAGERHATATVFDGADGEGPQQVTAFIGPRLGPEEHMGKDMIAAQGPLVDQPGWKIRMAFYTLDSQAAAPDYEVEILQLENGVTPMLLLDYQDFTVILTQEKIEALPVQNCQ